MSTRRELLQALSRGGLALAAGGSLASTTGTALAADDSHTEPSAGDDVTVLLNATMIDGTDADPRPNSVVVLAGDRIVFAGSYAGMGTFPAGAKVIDLSGKYVLPGFWDLHTHGSWLFDTFLPLHLANGVTGIREMVGAPGMEEIRDLLESGELVGPRMVLASALLDGPNSVWGGGDTGSGVIEINTPEEARAAVRTATAAGADFLKVYSFLAPEPYRALASEADRQGIRFSGHVPAQVTVDEAVRLGQHTVEHLYGMFLSTSGRKADLYRQLRAVFSDPERADEWASTMGELEMEAQQSPDPRLARRLFASMARRGTWQSPTLTVERTAYAPGEQILGDARLMDLLKRYIQPTMREQWRASAQSRLNRPPEVNERLRRYVEAKSRMAGELDRAGVRLVAGTDCWISFVFPGFSLHDELASLVDAGLSPHRALQTATRDAARCVGRERDSGTITAGKLADLVVLEDNPLRDIRNTARVHSVVSRGRYISPRERRKLLADAEEAARRDPPPEEQRVTVDVPALPSCCHAPEAVARPSRSGTS